MWIELSRITWQEATPDASKMAAVPIYRDRSAPRLSKSENWFRFSPASTTVLL
jgi:hypothetical protein